jgi:multiple sugar transport system permease protein
MSDHALPAGPGGTKQRSRLGSILIGIVMVIVLIWVMFPFYWAFLNSIKMPADTFGAKWIPWLQFEPTLKNWQDTLAIREVRQSLWNSTRIGVGGALVAVLLGVPAAYALARFHFGKPSNAGLSSWFLSQRIMPPVVFVPPIYLLARTFGATDNVWVLALLNGTFTMVFPVIILSQSFRELPRELEEAAQVDGASRLEIFLRIALPLVAPGLVAAFIIALAYSWNEFLFALTLTSEKAIPMPVVIAGAEHTRGVDFQFVGTRTLLTMGPPLIMALLAQRYVVRGLSFGAVKG